MLFSTSLVAMILSPRLLRIINTKVHLKSNLVHESSDYNTDRPQRQSTICELTFPSRIGALKLNRKRLMVVLEDIIFIYDIQTMKTLHQIVTPTNPFGESKGSQKKEGRRLHKLAICALSPHPEHNYIAYPMRRKEHTPAQVPAHAPPSVQKGMEPMGGDVMLFDANEMQEIKVIPAHQAPLSCIAINNEGTVLATASEKGTVIRVFALPSAQKLYQFRRGSMPARIHCMTFNATSTLLCVSSATETIHIFKLNPQSSSNDEAIRPTSSDKSRAMSSSPSDHERSASPSASSDQAGSTNMDVSISDTPPTSATQPRHPTFMSMMRRTSQTVSSSFVTRAAGYLPSAVTEIWEPTRDFAWVKTPKSRSGQLVKSVVAMASNAPQVMVATSEGDFLVFNIDLEKGGEGTLIRQYSYVKSLHSYHDWYD